MIDAIVGNRRAGLTALADQVTDPSLTILLSVGIVPPLRESWLNPSSTKRMTCSVGGLVGIAFPSGEEGRVGAAAEETMIETEHRLIVSALSQLFFHLICVRLRFKSKREWLP
jgi:hypothetical protein